MPTKKTATKKTATKKAASRTRARKKASTDTVPSNPSPLSVISEAMNRMGGRAGKNYNLRSPGDLFAGFVDVPDFMVQYAHACPGLVKGTIFELIGPEHIGKTTMGFHMIKQIMKQGGYCLYLETENKPMLENRIARILSNNPVKGKEMLSMISSDHAWTIHEAIDKIENWCKAMRSKEVQKELGLSSDTPIAVMVDTWSKLMGPGEAAGRYKYGPAKKGEKEKKAKLAGEQVKMEHAAVAHSWLRMAPQFLNEYNVILFINAHQNISAMQDQFSSFLPQSYKDKRNKTKIGGTAFNQSSAFQWIMVKGAEIKDESKTVIGHQVNARVDKNSYGDNAREFKFGILSRFDLDTEDWVQSPVHSELTVAELMVNHSILGTSVTNGKYTCKTLGIYDLPSRQFGKALNRQPDEFWAYLRRCLDIFHPSVEGKNTEQLKEALAAAIETSTESDDDDMEHDGTVLEDEEQA